MKISYQQRIVEIKREHVLALEPVISRLKVGESLLYEFFTTTLISVQYNILILSRSRIVYAYQSIL